MKSERAPYWRVRARLAILAIVAVVPFALFIAYQAMEIRQRRIDEALERAHHFAKLAAESHDNIVSQARSFLTAIANAPEVTSGTFEACTKYLDLVTQARPWSSGVWIVGADGRVRCTTIPEGIGVDLSGRAEFERALKAEGFTVSDVYTGKVTRKLQATASIAARDQRTGERLLVAVTLDLSLFAQISANIGQRSGAGVILLDGKGVVLSAYPTVELAGSDLSGHGSISRLLKRTEGSVEATGPRGEPMLAGFVTIAGTDMRLAVGFKRDAVLANVRRGVTHAVMIFIGVAFMIAGLIWFAGRRAFVQPMQKLDSLLRATLENMEQGVIVVDHDGTVPLCNKRAMQLLDLPPSLMHAHPHKDDIWAHQHASGEFANITSHSQERLLPLINDLQVGVYERERPNGRTVEVRTTALADGGVLRTYSDITERKAADANLRDSEERFRLLAESATDMIFKLDLDFVRQYVSPASFEILGYRPEELVGQNPVTMIHPEDEERVCKTFKAVASGVERSSVTNRIRHRNGSWVWVEAELRLIRHKVTGAPNGIIGALRDITARKHSEMQLEAANQRLETLALHDGLTGLANRRLLDSTFEREFARSRREWSPLSVLLIDVDHFKAYNDRYGHLQGDACLKSLAQAIRTRAKRPCDLVARYGGEEIAVLLPDTTLEGATELGEQICQSVRDLEIEHASSGWGRVTVSVGATSVIAGTQNSPEDILALADTALYRAKANGRNRVESISGSEHLRAA